MKKLKYMSLILALAACTSVFVACDDDDDDDNGSTIVASNSGKKATSISVFGRTVLEMEYDNSGRIVKLTDNYVDYDEITFSYDLLMMIISDGDETEEATLKTNKNGYVTSVQIFGHGYGETWETSSTCQYDSNGCIKNIVTQDEDGNRTITFTWKNGDLVEVKEVEDGETEIITAVYGNDLNTHQQGTIGQLWLRGFECFTSLFGQNSKHLPISITKDGETVELSYDFNKDGTIKTEFFKPVVASDSIEFTYSYE